MISTILAAVANNFGILWPQFWTQYGFDGSAPTVPFLYGPDATTKQNAPNQIVAVLADEPFVGSEVHSSQPSGAPRELNRMWTRMHFYCWGQKGILTPWQTSTSYLLLDDVIPTLGNQNGYWFQVTTGGTSGLTEPTWTMSYGTTVDDGTVVWTNMGTVDAFRIYDTDVTDLMRITMAATMHYTLVGNYKAVKGSWYDKSDLLVMDGTVNRVSFDVLIPVPDLAPNTATINSLSITGQVNLLIPA